MTGLCLVVLEMNTIHIQYIFGNRFFIKSIQFCVLKIQSTYKWLVFNVIENFLKLSSLVASSDAQHQCTELNTRLNGSNGLCTRKFNTMLKNKERKG